MSIAHAHVPAAQRIERIGHGLQMLQLGAIDPRGVFIARQAGGIVAVQVCVALGGASTLFWLPTTEDGVADALVQAGLDWARSNGCKIAQALAGRGDEPLMGPLIRRGFLGVTRLRQMVRDLTDLPYSSLELLQFASYASVPPELFAATLNRTYEGTLDCPEMNDERTIDDVVAGHKAQGAFHPDMWWLAYHGADPIGVIMLSQMPNGWMWELAYLGITAEWRGRGFGRSMAVHAMQTLRERGAFRLVLAVDERNTPALRLYESLGFVETESNLALLYFLRREAQG